MVCRVCGRIISNEEANFCEYCGTAVDAAREGVAVEVKYTDEAEQNNTDSDSAEMSGDTSGQQKVQGIIGAILGTAGMKEKENSMATWQWLVILLLPFVPVVGLLTFLFVLLVWAFGSTATRTRKSWARATLLMYIFAFIMMAYMLGGMMSDPAFTELMNSMMP